MATLEQQYLLLIDEIKTDEKTHDETKQQKIRKAADLLLKNGVQEDKISTRITADLRDTISSAYVRRCLESNFKEKLKVTNKIPVAVTAGGGSETSTGTEVSNKQQAAEEYEKNKYKLKPGAIKDVKGSSALERANAELERNETQANNSSRNELVQSYKQQVDQYQNQLEHLQHKIKKMETERLEHTTVTLSQEKFQEVARFVNDETVKRILFHFDENMIVTHITVPI